MFVVSLSHIILLLFLKFSILVNVSQSCCVQIEYELKILTIFVRFILCFITCFLLHLFTYDMVFSCYYLHVSIPLCVTLFSFMIEPNLTSKFPISIFVCICTCFQNNFTHYAISNIFQPHKSFYNFKRKHRFSYCPL